MIWTSHLIPPNMANNKRIYGAHIALSRIPGEYFGRASASLASAETAQPDETREAAVNIPGLGFVNIRYKRFTYKHRRMRHYCWVAESAVKME